MLVPSYADWQCRSSTTLEAVRPMLESLELCEEALATCTSALDESEARFRTLVDHAPEAVVILDADARHFVDANRTATELFDLPREALLGADPVGLSPPTQPCGAASPELAWERIEEALAGEAPSFDWVHRTPGGREIPCRVDLVRLPASGRRLVRGSVTDLTAQRRLEQQLLQWQKLELLGRLAGGIVHDLNGVLLAISGSVDALAQEQHTDSVRLEAEWVRNAVNQGARLTGRLLAFLRAEGPEQARLDLSAIARDTTKLLNRLLPPEIRLLTRLDDSVYVVGAQHELEQVLTNLVLNARDAMPTGGTVTMTARRERKLVRLLVEDTGTGMTEATRARMFEAFFTTKPKGKGSGIGLAVVQAVVHRMGGSIGVDSEPDKGTRIEVILPAAPLIR